MREKLRLPKRGAAHPRNRKRTAGASKLDSNHPPATEQSSMLLAGILNTERYAQPCEQDNSTISAPMLQRNDDDEILCAKEKPMCTTYAENGQRSFHQPCRTLLQRKCLNDILSEKMRLPNLIRTCCPIKKQRGGQTSALEMDAFTYAHELDWALSSEPTI